MPSILPSGSHGPTRRTCWRRRREPVSLHERWPRSFPRTRALWRPTSTSRCSIMPPPDSVMMAASHGGRPTPWPCRLQDQAFDIVACQFGVMFFPDKVQGYKEARRVSEAGRSFPIQCLGPDLRECLRPGRHGSAGRAVPARSAPFMARTPHGHHDVGKSRGELAAAGFASISVETVDGTSRAASARDVAIAYCQGTPLRNEIEARDPTGLEDATRAAQEALAQRFGTGPVEGRIRAHVFTAIR